MSALTVMVSPTPRLVVATANTPVPVTPGIRTMPSFGEVAASATMSGVGVAEASRSRVLMPTSVATGGVLIPANVKESSVGPKAPVGVMKSRKSFWGQGAGGAHAEMSTGVFGAPTSWGGLTAVSSSQ